MHISPNSLAIISELFTCIHIYLYMHVSDPKELHINMVMHLRVYLLSFWWFTSCIFTHQFVCLHPASLYRIESTSIVAARLLATAAVVKLRSIHPTHVQTAQKWASFSSTACFILWVMAQVRSSSIFIRVCSSGCTHAASRAAVCYQCTVDHRCDQQVCARSNTTKISQQSN